MKSRLGWPAWGLHASGVVLGLPSADLVARRDFRLHLRGRGRPTVEEQRDLVPQGPFAVDLHEDVPLVVRAGGVGGGGAHGVVAQEGAARIRIVGDPLEVGVGGGAPGEPAGEAAGEVIPAAAEERAHVAGAREVRHVEVAPRPVVARKEAREHHHVVASAGRLGPDARHLMRAWIEDPRAAAVRLLESGLHRRGNLDVHLFYPTAPRADGGAHVDHQAPPLPRRPRILAELLREGVHGAVERRIRAVLHPEHRVDEHARRLTGLRRRRPGAREEDGHDKRAENPKGSHDQPPGSGASGRMDAASQLTRTRDPTSTMPRRTGSYVTACRKVPATSNVYSTFSPRNVRLRTIPEATASPSGDLAFSGTRVRDSGRMTRRTDCPFVHASSVVTLSDDPHTSTATRPSVTPSTRLSTRLTRPMNWATKAERGAR